MEKPNGSHNRVKVPRIVFDGLEVIRQSGATNMLDRPVVIHLARAWNLAETADWIESIDTETYGRLIFEGPEVIPDEEMSQDLAGDSLPTLPTSPRFPEVPASDQIEVDQQRLNRIILALGKRASLTIADTYETEQMGVLIDHYHRVRVNAERSLLISNLIELSSIGIQLEELVSEIERGIQSLQSLIDPENNE